MLNINLKNKKNIFSYVLYTIIFLLFSSKSFSGIIEEQVNSERINTAYCKNIYLPNQKIDAIVSDFYDADYSLDCFSNIKNKVYKDMVLVFPDVNKIEKNFKGIINTADNIYIFLLDKKTSNIYYNSRSIEDLKQTKIYDDLKKLEHVKIFEVNVESSELNNIFLKSVSNTLIKSDFFKENIYSKYKKITKNDYLKSIYE